MAIGSWLRSRPAAVAAGLLQARPLMRAPIWLYRVGAGSLLGSRLLMLEHIGRKTGTLRHVVLEIVGHPTPDSFLVASGFGERAQWFRNVTANPAVKVYVGGRPPAAGTARILTQHEAEQVLGEYARQHPRAWNQFKPVLERTLGRSIDESGAALPIVELRLD